VVPCALLKKSYIQRRQGKNRIQTETEMESEKKMQKGAREKVGL
jgi:hypothetical protein